MIVLITNNPIRHEFEGITYFEVKGRLIVESFLKECKAKNKWVAKDYEASGLDAYLLKPLLLGLGNKDVQYCIDLCTIDISKWDIPADVKYIGHNLKYDIKLEMVHFNFHHRNIYDTMIAENKIYQGCQTNPNFKFNLEAVTFRHLNKGRMHGKDTRKDFIGGNPKTFVFKQEHIEYLAEDLIDLEAIKDSQMKNLIEYQLLEWMINVEFPLVYHLAKCELNGFNFDTEKWQENVDESVKKRHELACQLDEEIRYLRNNTPKCAQERLHGGEYDRKRNFQPRQIFTGLFGEMSKFEFYNVQSKGKAKNVKVDKKKKRVKQANSPFNINWGSDQQILYIFGCLGQPAPLQGNVGQKYGYLIPHLHETQKKVLDYSGYKLDKPNKKCLFTSGAGEGYTTGKNALTKYLIDKPKTPMRHFIMLLKQWREVNHEINSFGENFFDKLNTVTGRLHTEFRQANAVNSRFQSGGGYLQPDKYNAQNIPRKKKFRHCFKGELIDGQEPSIVTCDLSGAEVAILCDKSNDKNLYEWAIKQDDTHSPMVQNVWRNIFLFRAGKLAKAWFTPQGYKTLKDKPEVIALLEKSEDNKVKHWLNLSKTFTVSKKENKAYRQAGKNGTFGGLYGMKAAKAAETFNGTDSELMKLDSNYTPVNVNKEEGVIILMAQKAVIPDAYAYVESNVTLAFGQGYIQYDDRSKSRIWFPEVLKLFKEIEEEHDFEYGIKTPTIAYLGDGKYIALETSKEYKLEYRFMKDVDGQSRNVPISGTQSDCIKEAIVAICNYIEDNNLQGVKWLSQVHDELVFSMPKALDGQSEEYHNSEEKFNFPEFVKDAMTRAASKHMNFVKMGAEYDVLNSWTK
jgi:DNA polymerase I-like protein with 3'-5' exonuclease and polymerase domains